MFRFPRIFALIKKELSIMLKDGKSRYALFIPPLIQLILFSFVATLEVFNIHIAILNRDSGNYSTEIINEIHGAKRYFTNIMFLKKEEDIKDVINTSKVIGVVVFPFDFSASIENGRGAEVQILLDGRRLNSASIVGGYLEQIIQNGILEKLKNKPASNIITGNVITRNWFNPNLDFKWTIMPAMIALILSTSIMTLAGMSIAREREIGTFEGLLVTPLEPLEIIAGKGIASLIVGIFQGMLFFFIIRLIGIPFMGSFMLLLFAIIIYLCALIGIGLFTSSLCTTQQQAILCNFFFAIPITLTSGFSAPFENMPVWLQKASMIYNPVYHFLTIIRALFLKASDFHFLAHHFLALFLIAVFTTLFSSWFFKRRVL